MTSPALRGDSDGPAPPDPAVSGWRPEPFRPPLWARNPHVQTVAGKFLRPEPDVVLRREAWDTPDGDELVLDFARWPRRALLEGGECPLVVVIHGLEGNARRPYARLLYRELARRGMAAVGMNLRGCARPNRVARAYHSGETGDLRFVLEGLARRFPGRPLAAVGFSLGGNLLLKHLAEVAEGTDAPDGARPVAAAAVSVPYDLAAGARTLEASAMGRRYGRYFLDSLIEKVRVKRHLLADRVDVESALTSPTIRVFDDRVTAPLHGFRDAAHYYAESSAGPLLHAIRTPTLLVHARDDPFLPWDRVPVEHVDASPWLVPAFPDRGGHVGFLEGPPWSPRFWAEATVAAFLAVALTTAADGRPSTGTGRPH